MVRPPGPRPAGRGGDAAVGEVGPRVVALREAPVGRRRHRRRLRRRMARSLAGTGTKAAIDGRGGESEAEKEPIFFSPPPLFARPHLMGLFLQR